ncbi:MAG: DUF2339 domain-containing protein [Bacteroidales bacterium]
MDKDQNVAYRLEEKLNRLLLQHEKFQQEIASLKEEMIRLKKTGHPETMFSQESERDISLPDHNLHLQVPGSDQDLKNTPSEAQNGKKASLRFNLEKYIGENLANKVGIIITVIGVSIGVKYAIDHQMISPLVRIIFGYAFGLILLGLALRLKNKYTNYSSVLLSGSLAIMYFITFAAFDFYQLIPLVITYVLMIVFTVLAVYAAINYNRQVIAHIGLVGSYAIPFLLGAGFDNIVFLFSYMAIINSGILVIAFLKNWKPLYIVAFIITWLIWLTWYVSDYNFTGFFSISVIFLSVNFLLFYLIFLAYKLLKNEKFDAADVLILLVNSSIYFMIGYRLLKDHQIGIDYPGFFAVLNAIIHLGVSVLIYAKKLADRSLMYFVAGLALVFITIAIPIQLNGRWVTLLWTGEALVLYLAGSNRGVKFYRYLAYPLMVLAFISLVHDWSMVYDRKYFDENSLNAIPFININFLESLIFITAFSVINYRYFAFPSVAQDYFTRFVRILNFLIPAILIVAVYYAVRLEIAEYWNRLLHKPADLAVSNYYLADLRRFKSIWLMNYSLLFVSALSFFNYRVIKSMKMLRVNMVLNVFFILLFLLSGLYALSELRESYLNLYESDDYTPGIFHLVIRYVTYLVAAITCCITVIIAEWSDLQKQRKNYQELAFYLFLLWVISSELIHWMDILNSKQSYKFGLTILWGAYALAIVLLGIIKRKKHLRVGAIVLFGATLLKLFFYDISHLDMLPKTVIFIILGALLLIISFLYNKYTQLIIDERDNNTHQSE